MSFVTLMISWLSTMNPLYLSHSLEMPLPMALVLSSHMFYMTAAKSPLHLLPNLFHLANAPTHRLRKKLSHFCCQEIHQYLYGRKFQLVNDHNPLLAILGPKKGIPSLAPVRLQRWAVLLSAYHYEIYYKRTDEHANANSLVIPTRTSLPKQQLYSTSHSLRHYQSLLQKLPRQPELTQCSVKSITIPNQAGQNNWMRQ